VTRKPKRNAPLYNSPVVDIANALDALKIPYVFTGSFAYAANKGLPRGTKDVDVVVYAPSRLKLAELLNGLAEAGVEVDPRAALRALDSERFVGIPMPVGAPGKGEPQATFVVELVLPKVPTLDEKVLRRAVTVPYPDRPSGIPVVTLEDYVLFKVIFFRDEDKFAVEEALRTTPGLDVGYVMISLGLVYPVESERVQWFASMAHKYGFAKNPRTRQRRPRT